MEKISATGIMYALLAIFVFLQFSSHVRAVDIIFYENTSYCYGKGYSFNTIADRICCEVSAKDGGSVLVTSTSGSGTKSHFYRNGGCTKQVGTGSGNFCMVGGQFTGAFWFNARRRSLLGELGGETCDSQMKPTGVVYTEDGMKGNWMLSSSDAAELYSQMENVPDEEKASWLESHGATYNEL